MKTRSTIASLLLFAALARGAAVGQVIVPPGEKQPLLRLEAGGPTSFVTALAFSPDGQTLYAGGWDKVVRVWTLDAKSGQFHLDEGVAYRVPIGPGLDGAINAMAISSDGVHLAVAGKGVIRQGAGFRQPGRVFPSLGAMTTAMRLDQGMIYLFDTRSGKVRLLRQHLGPVLSMDFAPVVAGRSPELISTGQDWDAKARRYVGSVRLWDTGALKYLDGLGMASPGRRPGLAIWRTGDGLRQIRVAIAWGDGELRIWDVEPGRMVRKQNDGKYNNTVAFLPSASRLASGSFRGRNGRVRQWNIPAGGDPSVIAQPIAQLAAGEGVFYNPISLISVASKAGGATDHLAAVVQVSRGRKVEYELRLFDARPRSFGTERGRVALWSGGGSHPALAAAGGGSHLAVAGSPEHEIQVFSIAKLLAGRAAPQRLRSAGAVVRYASFVRKGKQLGIALGGDPKARAGFTAKEPRENDRIFDFQKRAVVDDRAGWQVAAARPGNLSVVHRTEQTTDRAGRKVLRSVITVREGKLTRKIYLQPSEVMTDYALLPARKPLDTPLLAVVADLLGQPTFYVYNARLGQQIRLLRGHTERIRSVDFSDDGRLLISAGDDQTVCVWSLTDLDKTLGRRGMLPGLAVEKKGQAIVVARVDDDSPVRNQLQVGDLLKGLVEKGKLIGWQTPQDFYNTFWRKRPGLRLLLRIGRGGRAVDLQLTVGQGVDERKPLFSLFVTRAKREADRQWIGWSPLGPYESSDPRVERLLGWHFNTGDADAPTSFARAGQYRKRYYRRGVLQDLLEFGGRRPLPPPPPLPRPTMELQIEDLWGEVSGSDGHIVLRSPGEKLRLAIFGTDSEKIDSVRWQLDKRQLDEKTGGPFTRSADDGWVADIKQMPWQRGKFKIRAILRTAEEMPQQFTETISIRFQPPAPRVKISSAKRQTVKQAAFDFEATVAGSSPDQPVEVRLYQGRKQVALQRFKSAQPKTISKHLDLAVGANVIRLVARNVDALGGYEELETARGGISATYDRKEVPPPEILIRSIAPLDEEGSAGERSDVQPGGVLLVDAARIRLTGQITAQQELILAASTLDETKPAVALDGFRPGVAKMFAIDKRLKLTPGKQTIFLQAKTADSTLSKARVTIDYRPRVPSAEIISPPDELVLVEGVAAPQGVVVKPGEAAMIEVSGRLTLPADAQPFEAAGMVDGRLLPGKVNVDLKAGTFTTEVPFHRGASRIQIRLTNEWKSVSITPETVLNYRRPPRIDSVTSGEVGTQAFVTITTRVRSVLPPRQIEVNGRRSNVKPVAGDPGQWVLQTANVPLNQGQNRIEVRVWSDDGASVKPGVLNVAFMPPPPPKAEIEIIEPARDTTVASRQVHVKFQVRSASGLKSLELIRGSEVLYRHEKLAAAAGNRPLLIETDVELKPALNRLKIVAINDGGEQTASVTLSYVHRPVQVVIDKLQLPRKAGRPAVTLFPKMRGGRLVFDAPVPEGNVRIYGHVKWSDSQDKRFAQTQNVQVWVNGFQQVPSQLKTSRERAGVKLFDTLVVLNRLEDNTIELGLPGLEHEASSRLDFQVDCVRPELRQRLHLVIVGVGATDGDALVSGALKAMKARRTTSGKIRRIAPITAAAFDKGSIYPPLVGRVKKVRIWMTLMQVKSAIARRTRGSAPNEVIVIYYQGGETIKSDGGFFLTTSDTSLYADPAKGSISREELADFSAKTRGAHILLLDVQRDKSGAGQSMITARWPGESHAAMLRYAWRVSKNTNIMSALGGSTAPTESLDEVDRYLGERSKQYADVLDYDRHVPKAIAGLILGKSEP